jgi:hypothetical protein
MKPAMRMAALGAAFAINALALLAVHAAMVDGSERTAQSTCAAPNAP